MLENCSRTAIAGVILSLATVAAAADGERGNAAAISWLIGFGLTYGGEKLAEVEGEYDGDRYNQDLRGGDLMTVAAGMVVYLPQPEWSVQTTISYFFDEVSADNGDIRFDRYPLELIPFYNFGKHRIGAGLSYHLSPKLELKEIDGPKVTFDDALGWLVEYDFSFSGWENRGFVLGVRYLWINYEVDEIDGSPASGDNVDGNHVGVHVDLMF